MVDITMNGWSFCKLASCQMEHEARLIDGFVIARHPRLKRNRPGRTYSTDFLFPEFDLLWNSVPDFDDFWPLFVRLFEALEGGISMWLIYSYFIFESWQEASFWSSKIWLTSNRNTTTAAFRNGISIALAAHESSAGLPGPAKNLKCNRRSLD